MDNTIVRMDATGRETFKRRNFSFSQADKFYNCPRKFWHYDVAKLIKEPEGEAMKEGFRVHKAMAERITNNKALPTEYAHYEKWVDLLVPGDPKVKVLTEHRLAMTYELKPCEYFSRVDEVWLRAQADLLVIDGERALSVDWKTGKEKDPRYEVLPPNFQLRLTALLIFLHFPEVKHVTSSYVYLTDNISASFDMPKEDIREFTKQMYEVAGVFQRAFNKNNFPPRRSGLSKRFCAVTSCEFHGKGPNE